MCTHCRRERSPLHQNVTDYVHSDPEGQPDYLRPDRTDRVGGGRRTSVPVATATVLKVVSTGQGLDKVRLVKPYSVRVGFGSITITQDQPTAKLLSKLQRCHKISKQSCHCSPLYSRTAMFSRGHCIPARLSPGQLEQRNGLVHQGTMTQFATEHNSHSFISRRAG